MPRRKRPKAWTPAALKTPNEAVIARPVDWERRALELVRVYNACVCRVNEGRAPQTGIRSPNENTLEVMWGLARFCAELGVEPASWIYAVHAAQSWKLPAGQVALFSKGYKRTYDGLSAEEHGHVTGMTARRAPRFRPFVDLSIGAERVKARYAARGRTDLCMTAVDVTFGWHAQSASCAACPEAERCKKSTIALARAQA